LAAQRNTSGAQCNVFGRNTKMVGDRCNQIARKWIGVPVYLGRSGNDRGLHTLKWCMMTLIT
jgi:hypothetical protein